MSLTFEQITTDYLFGAVGEPVPEVEINPMLYISSNAACPGEKNGNRIISLPNKEPAYIAAGSKAADEFDKLYFATIEDANDESKVLALAILLISINKILVERKINKLCFYVLRHGHYQLTYYNLGNTDSDISRMAWFFCQNFPKVDNYWKLMFLINREAIEKLCSLSDKIKELFDTAILDTLDACYFDYTFVKENFYQKPVFNPNSRQKFITSNNGAPKKNGSVSNANTSGTKATASGSKVIASVPKAVTSGTNATASGIKANSTFASVCGKTPIVTAPVVQKNFPAGTSYVEKKEEIRIAEKLPTEILSLGFQSDLARRIIFKKNSTQFFEEKQEDQFEKMIGCLTGHGIEISQDIQNELENIYSEPDGVYLEPINEDAHAGLNVIVDKKGMKYYFPIIKIFGKFAYADGEKQSFVYLNDCEFEYEDEDEEEIENEN
jgi:hypothetical protein